jgi:hypothetical protein
MISKVDENLRFWDVHHAVDRIPLKIIRQNFEKDRLTKEELARTHSTSD